MCGVLLLNNPMAWTYFKKKWKRVEALNVNAETFVPKNADTENPDLHFGRPKQKKADNTIDLQQRPSAFMKQSTVSKTTAPLVSHHRDVHAPFSMNTDSDQNHMLSVG